MNSEQRRGGRTQGPAGAREQVYQGLRAQILRLDPAAAGLQQGSVDRVVWGALMETGYPRGTATLVALADCPAGESNLRKAPVEAVQHMTVGHPRRCRAPSRS